jgi:transposase-like protein
MDQRNDDVQQASQWYCPELIVRSLPGGRRIFDQSVKAGLIERLRQSPQAVDEVARVNGLRREMVQRWVVPLKRSPHKGRRSQKVAAVAARPALMPVRIQSAPMVKAIAVECELVLPKGLLRIRCNVGDLGGVIAQLQ